MLTKCCHILLKMRTTAQNAHTLFKGLNAKKLSQNAHTLTNIAQNAHILLKMRTLCS